jgi:hypothetical protein
MQSKETASNANGWQHATKVMAGALTNKATLPEGATSDMLTYVLAHQGHVYGSLNVANSG